MDEDELEDVRRTNLQTTAAYDTFGDAAAEAARQAVRDVAAAARPAPIPGMLPDELVVPVAEGIGVQLLQRMGWRQGKGIGGGALGDAPFATTAAELPTRESKWGRVAGVGPENTPLHLVPPKSDTHGLGFDPFKGAEEFRAAKRLRAEASRPGSNPREGPRGRGIAFGTGVLDEDDAYGILDDYVTHDDVGSYDDTAGVDAQGMPRSRGPHVGRSGLGDRLALKGFAYEVQEESENEEESDGYGGKRRKVGMIAGPAAPLLLHSAEHVARKGLIPGFVGAQHGGTTRQPYYPPPAVPYGYVPIHTPAVAASTGGAAAAPKPPLPAAAPPPKAPPPGDKDIQQEIDTIAFYVARNGPAFEAVARDQQIKEGRRTFLLRGGDGAAYYAWKLHSLRVLILGPKAAAQAAQGAGTAAATAHTPRHLRAIGQRSAPLTAEERGAILGEQPLRQSGGSAAAAAPAAVAPSPAQQAQQDRGSLGRSLLNVAAEDRQRLQAMLGSTFVKASTSEVLDPNPAGMQGGLRPGAKAQPKIAPTQPKEGPAAAATAASAAAGAPSSQPRKVVTVEDLSRPALESLSGPSSGRDAAAAAAAARGIPIRRTEEWRPEPLLCKRLDVPDPYKGRPQEIRTSNFRTDYFALPATADAAAAALAQAAGAAAPGAEDFLLPPAVRVAAEEAAARAVAQAGVPTAAPEAPFALPHPPSDGMAPYTGQFNSEPAAEEDVSGAAEEFLSSLFSTAGGGAGGEGGGPGAFADAALAASVVERPLDLFKAIFDATDSESETEVDGTAGNGEREVGAKGAGEPLPGSSVEREGAGMAQHAPQHVAAQRNAVPRSPISTAGGGNAFGFAKFRRSEGAGGGGRGGGDPGPGGSHAVPAVVDPAVQERVQAALKVLKEAQKKEKKRHSERKKEHKEKGHKHR